MWLATLVVASQRPFVLRNDLIGSKAVAKIDAIGKELKQKCGISAYVIATNEHFPAGYNLVEDLRRRYQTKLHEPYAVLYFAPFATIKEGVSARGRFGLIPSSQDVRRMYRYDSVRDATIDVVAVKDSNRLKDKVTVGVVQGYSVLADEIAKHHGVTMRETIPNTTAPVLWVLRILIYSGTVIVLWFFVIKPWIRKRQGG